MTGLMMTGSMGSKLVVILTMGSLTACAANPATGVAASGDPLRVAYSTGTGSYVANEVVGTDVHTDSQGNEIGATDHYRPVEHKFRWHDWKYFQGRDEVDEHDYYRLAGDAEGADQIEKIRASAALKMKIGAPLMVVGVATALAFSLVAGSSSNQTLKTAGYVGGSTLGSVGGLVWYWGRNQMAKRHHLPASRADRNADVVEMCNESRCTTQLGGRSRGTASRR